MYEIRPCGDFTYSMPCSQTTANTPRCKENKCNNDWYEAKKENRTFKSKFIIVRHTDYNKDINNYFTWVLSSIKMDRMEPHNIKFWTLNNETFLGRQKGICASAVECN